MARAERRSASHPTAGAAVYTHFTTAGSPLNVIWASFPAVGSDTFAPPLLDAPPESDQLADYDREHFATYLFLLDWSAAMVIGTAKSITFSV